VRRVERDQRALTRHSVFAPAPPGLFASSFFCFVLF